MTFQVTINLPEQIVSPLWESPEDFAQQMRLAAAIKWYELGQISQSTASEIAGISTPAFLVAFMQFQATPNKQIEEKGTDANEDRQIMLSKLRNELRQTHPFMKLSKEEILVKLRHTREAVYDELYGYRHHAN